MFQEEQSTGRLVEHACGARGDLSRAVLDAMVALVRSGWEGAPVLMPTTPGSPRSSKAM